MAKTGDENLTPMMRPYRSIKETCGDMILMFRPGDVLKGLGDFYEMFVEDANVAARVMDVPLTSKPAGGGKKVPLAGLPIVL